MPTRSEHFFADYSRAFDARDPAQIARFYAFPAVIMSDRGKSLYRNEQEVEQATSELLQSLQAAGVVRHQAEVSQAMRLSQSIVFANVRWRFYSDQDALKFSCFTSYTLQKTANDNLKILVAVIDDEEKAIAQILHQP